MLSAGDELGDGSLKRSLQVSTLWSECAMEDATIGNMSLPIFAYCVSNKDLGSFLSVWGPNLGVPLIDNYL